MGLPWGASRSDQALRIEGREHSEADMTEKTNDMEYFKGRARQEHALAEQAEDLSARRAHLRLAEAYERKATGKEWLSNRFPRKSIRPASPA